MIVRFLHLSDFHLKGEGDPVNEFKQDMVTRSLAEKVESLAAQGETFDFVVVTGDLAYGGKEADYAVAKVMCERILKAARLENKPERLFLVPGNHDVDRDAINEFYLVHYQCETQDEFHGKVAKPVFFTNLMEKFAAYHRFAEEATKTKRYDGKSFHYAETLRLERGGDSSAVNIRMLGLNSAILAGYNGDDDRKLALGLFQVQNALDAREGPAELTVAFFHHPFSCHHGFDGVSRNRLADKADLILFGHRHKPENFFRKDDAGSAAYVGAGACYGTRESENAFDVVEIDLTRREGRVQFYEYVPDHQAWSINAKANPKDKYGVFRFDLPALPGPDPGGEGSGDGEDKEARKTAGAEKSRWEMDVQTYFDKAAARHSTLPLAGFKTNVKVPILVEDIYVPLRAMAHVQPCPDGRYACADDAEKKLRGTESLREREDVDLTEAFFLAADYNRRGLVILGDPGSGKTTLLKRLLLYCYHEGPRSLGLPSDAVPVFLPLRDLTDVDAGLKTFLKQQLSVRNIRMPDGFAEKLVEKKRALFLLDGLDEVSDPSRRAEVSDWIDDAIDTYRNRHWFAVTCRFAGYAEKTRLGPHFLEMHVRPLSKQSAERFVGNWYRVVETGLAPASRRARAEKKAEQRAKDLVARLGGGEFRASKVFEMTRNPLLLTNLCLVHRDKGELPKSRADLYEDCIEVLLERWRRAGGVETRLDVKTGLAVLQPAAYWMHLEEGRKRADGKELAEAIEAPLKEARWEHGSAEDFLKIVRDESGLLTGWGDGSYGFMHLNFQEYLAAREFRNRAAVDHDALDEIAERFGQPWFQEVILLFLALRDPSMFKPFFQRLVRKDAFADPQNSEMLEMCLDDASGPSPEPFLTLLKEDPGRDESLWKRQWTALQILERLVPDLKYADFFRPTLQALESHPSRKIARWAGGEDGSESRGAIKPGPSGYELVPVPGGKFLMGSDPSEKGRDDDEGPVHEVRVGPFHMGRYPVTNAEYERFLKANPGVEEPEYWGERKFNRPEQPVVGVDWHDAKKFAEWAGLALPSEAQWEYACRAGTTTRYYTGDEEKDLDRAGWYDENSGGRTHPVGEKEPNEYGLYDMHGNVWEWCEDDRHGNYNGAPDDGRAWVDEPRGSGRVVRGGSWYEFAGACRAAIRDGGGPSYRIDFFGFRLVFLPGLPPI